ncbi:hypothetical protein GCM10025868_47120 [Angustibacter aerolatus]|uniref:Uncharacterized protein n=1 Tax=Angustibacter aerolatus TaxID=1162965 RepID=A0ABQ6JRJ7_9ACTN|nr:hypothetical protein GCM10025868_47120 [Angustibacter aerolatus]
MPAPTRAVVFVNSWSLIDQLIERASASDVDAVTWARPCASVATAHCPFGYVEVRAGAAGLDVSTVKGVSVDQALLIPAALVALARR